MKITIRPKSFRQRVARLALRFAIAFPTAIVAAEPTAAPLQETSAKSAEAESSKTSVKRETIKNSLDMTFVRIPAGTFVMGSPETEFNRYPGETQHRVTLTKDFYLSIYETTLGQFRQFVAETNYVTDAEKNGEGGLGYDMFAKGITISPAFSWRRVGFPQTENHPVANLSWNDATAFCEWLSQKEGLHYRLPTEAEWEYSYRAGTQMRYVWGEKRESLIGNANVRERALVHRCADTAKDAEKWNDGFAFASPVGTFKPNPFGIYDMNGNVWEWVQDWYADYDGDAVDPKGPASGEKRIMRGGSWYNMQILQRAAQRYPYVQNRYFHSTGFRVLREISPETPVVTGD